MKIEQDKSGYGRIALEPDDEQRIKAVRQDPPKPARLMIGIYPVVPRGNGYSWDWSVFLDGALILDSATFYKTESEARAAAEAYRDELLAHFRGGGE